MRSLAQCLLVMLVLSCAVARPIAAQPSADSAAAAARSSLAPTSAPPWNPPAAVPRWEPWEAALQFPGRVVSLPLSGLGWMGEQTLGYLEESQLVGKALGFLAVTQLYGAYVAPASLGDRTGTGLELRWIPPFLKDRVLLELSGSTRQYNRERVAVNWGPLRAIYGSEWRSRDLFYGTGIDASIDGKSAYALRTQSIRVALVHPHHIANDALRVAEVAAVYPSLLPPKHPIRTQFAVWAGPRYEFMTDGRDAKLESFEVLHPAVAAGTLRQAVEHFTWGGRMLFDRRVGSPHWTHGWRLRLDGQRFDRSIEALALKNNSTNAKPFTQLSAQAEIGTSWGRDPRTVRLLARIMDQTLDDGGGTYLFSDLPWLGGSDYLRGYETGRFRDIDMVAGRASYIFPIGKSLEFDLHADVGGVFPEMEAARMDRLVNSYGTVLRVRGDRSLIGNVGFEWSREQTRFRFGFGAEQ